MFSNILPVIQELLRWTIIFWISNKYPDKFASLLLVRKIKATGAKRSPSPSPCSYTVKNERGLKIGIKIFTEINK